MQLSLNIEFEIRALVKERRGTMEDCVYCNKEKECYALIPFTNYYGCEVDIYNGAHHSVCEECYKEKNINGYLDDLLYHERRIDVVKSQKYSRERHKLNRKVAIVQQNNEYKDSRISPLSKQTRCVLFEKISLLRDKKYG